MAGPWPIGVERVSSKRRKREIRVGPNQCRSRQAAESRTAEQAAPRRLARLVNAGLNSRRTDFPERFYKLRLSRHRRSAVSGAAASPVEGSAWRALGSFRRRSAAMRPMSHSAAVHAPGANLTALHGFEARPARPKRGGTDFASNSKNDNSNSHADFRAKLARAGARERRPGRAAPPATCPAALGHQRRLATEMALWRTSR